MERITDESLSVFDEAFREVRKIVKNLNTDEDFLKLDRLGVLIDDDDLAVDRWCSLP